MRVLLFLALLASVFGFNSIRLSLLGFRGRTKLSARNELFMAMGSISKVSFKVSSLKQSIDFYKKAIGMDVDMQEGKIASLSFGGDISLELEESGDALDSKLKGDGFLGIGVAFPDAKMICDAAEQEGGAVTFPFGEYAYGASLVPDQDELKQFPVTYGKISDPDGYIIEVMQGFRAEPFIKATLSVLDLDDAISFYTKDLGLKLLRKRSNVNSKPKNASFVAYVGAGESEEDGPYLELVYKYATEKVNVGKCLKGITLAGCEGNKNGAISDLDGYPLLLA